MDEQTDDYKIYMRKRCGFCRKNIYVDEQYRYHKTIDNRERYYCCRDHMEKHTGYKGAGDSHKTVVLDSDKAAIRELYFVKMCSIEYISEKLGYTYGTIAAYCYGIIENFEG